MGLAQVKAIYIYIYIYIYISHMTNKKYRYIIKRKSTLINIVSGCVERFEHRTDL